MNSLTPLGAALVLAGLAAVAPGATAQHLQHLDGPPERLTLDYGTGAIRASGPAQAADASATTFSNVTSSGLFSVVPSGEEWVDWGAKSGGLTTVVCAVEIGYGTNAMDVSMGGPGAALDVAIYSGTAGSCGAGDVASEVARLSFTGLPASLDGSAAGYTMEVLLGPAAFLLADGPIGWGYVGVDGLTGPVLISVGADSTGTSDLYDVYTPAPAPTGVCSGPFGFAFPAVASFHLRIDEDDGSQPGSQVVRSGSGANVGVLALGPQAPKIGQPWQPEITTDAVSGPLFDFVAFSAAPDPGTNLPGLGEVLISIASPAPFFTLVQPANTGPFTAPMPLSCNLIGVAIYSQGGQVGTVIGLTNAIDLVIGV